jgi:hypothetical protein
VSAPRVLASEDGAAVFVGINHDAPLDMPPWIVRRVLDAGRQSGFWYEGGGGDRAKITKKLGAVSWKGSWDDLVKSDSGDFYYALFSNSKAGTAAVVDRVADPSKSILDALVAAGDEIAHEALRGKVGRRKLIAFLGDCGAGLLRAADAPATKAGLRAFIRQGERVMWPDNWRSGPTAASRVALRANKIRLDTILGRCGVYFLGGDHIPTLRTMHQALRPMTMTPNPTTKPTPLKAAG